ncbi:MAG: tRNA pseudouridine(55) synthase TruB [Nanoarchaeota archaeon]
MPFQNLKLLSYSEHGEILSYLNQRLGINKIPGILIQRGEERLFLFQGNFTRNQIRELENTIYIERAGVYIGKIIESKSTGQRDVRLSIEGTQIFAKQISKNIIQLNSEQVKEWMSGNELPISTPTKDKGFVAIQFKETGDFLGCAQASEEKITNFIPKNRRLKQKYI